MSSGVTRRELLHAGAAAGLSAGAAGLALDPLLSQVLAAPSRRGHVKDIEHVVVLIQENRSFDHYFGTFPGVEGLGTAQARMVQAQPGYPVPGYGGQLLPFHLATGGAPQCFPDITHDWAPQHQSWNGGAMDGFVRTHLQVDGAQAGPATMGYYERADIPFYHALAEAFTMCDHYHSSVIGPTYPNRLMSVSATLDPDGRKGGPLLFTPSVSGYSDFLARFRGRFTWTTMFEQLSAHRVSWKVYSGAAGGSLDNMLLLFRQYQTNPALAARGLKPSYPADFLADLSHNRLPQVSWLLTGFAQTEHPGYASAKVGEYAVRQVLEALVAKPEVWKKTALFLTWDENGGFFDHVNPPTPPPGTAGEYVTVNPLPSDAGGIAGPVGLGFRVPMIVVSPFSRGGFVSSQLFDHTSLLRFLETRFGAEVPNLSAWRRAHTGDLTGAFNFAAAPRPARVRLPAVTLTTQELNTGGCVNGAPPVTVPPNSPPMQLPGRPRRPSGLR